MDTATLRPGGVPPGGGRCAAVRAARVRRAKPCSRLLARSPAVSGPVVRPAHDGRANSSPAPGSSNTNTATLQTRPTASPNAAPITRSSQPNGPSCAAFDSRSPHACITAATPRPLKAATDQRSSVNTNSGLAECHCVPTQSATADPTRTPSTRPAKANTCASVPRRSPRISNTPDRVTKTQSSQVRCGSPSSGISSPVCAAPCSCAWRRSACACAAHWASRSADGDEGPP